jgi:hypothetical protein
MSRLLKPFCIDEPGELVELISGAVFDILDGGVLLDGAIGNEEFGYFDLVGVNGYGEGVFFFINFSGCEAEYLRLLKCMRWYRENRYVLQKLYAGRAALSPVPLVFVVAPFYSDSMRKVLLDIREGRITLMKYVAFLCSDEKKSLFLEKVQAPSPCAGKADPIRVSETPPSRPAPDWSKARPPERIEDLRKLRSEIQTDITNISDEELFDLLK